MERRARLGTADQDVFINVVGGLRLGEPAADLGVVAAIASAIRDVELDPDSVFVGEVGLGGEVRPVQQLERRLSEAARLGFKRAFVARTSELAGRDPPLELERACLM